MAKNPISIQAIDHIVLRTDNTAAMCRFYCDVLGCSIERDTSPELGLTQLRAGNALIDIVSVESELGRMGGGSPTKKDNNVDHFCLQIAPFNEAILIRYLNKLQIPHGGFTPRYGATGYARSIYVKDPDGNTVELRS